MSDNEHHYHLPVRPYSPIDALNRRAAALGSVGYAQAASHANYNGHAVSVSWNDYRKYYIAQYFWGERVVLARGTLEHCIEAAMHEYNRGALGASVDVSVLGEDIEQIAKFPQLLLGREGRPLWLTWRHECAARAARDSANPQAGAMLFDWTLMQAAETEEAYEAALKAKHGRIWTR
jgi:hypothetical protein